MTEPALLPTPSPTRTTLPATQCISVRRPPALPPFLTLLLSLWDQKFETFGAHICKKWSGGGKWSRLGSLFSGNTAVGALVCLLTLWSLPEAGGVRMGWGRPLGPTVRICPGKVENLPFPCPRCWWPDPFFVADAYSYRTRVRSTPQAPQTSQGDCLGQGAASAFKQQHSLRT